ncbi:hypothetical protein EJB05_33965, partial [Eragrostis curvula]
MDRRPEDLEGNQTRPSNPLGQVTPPISTPAINGAQVSQATALSRANPNGSGATRRFGNPHRHGQGLVAPAVDHHHHPSRLHILTSRCSHWTVRTFDVYLRENGVSVHVVDDVADECDALVAAFLAQDEPVEEESGPAESVGENRLPPTANFHSTGLRRDQLGLVPAPSSFGDDDDVGSRCSARRAAAAAARKRRSTIMAEKKKAAARARAQKLAAARGSREGTQG